MGPGRQQGITENTGSHRLQIVEYIHVLVARTRNVLRGAPGSRAGGQEEGRRRPVFRDHGQCLGPAAGETTPLFLRTLSLGTNSKFV